MNKLENLQAVREAPSISIDLQMQFDSLGMTPLSIEKMGRYRKLERDMGLATIQLFGDIFTPDQKKYLSSPNMIILGEKDHKRFWKLWVASSNELTPERIEKLTLGGKIYTEYGKLDQTEEADNAQAIQSPQEEKKQTFINGVLLYNGRLPIFVLTDGENDALIDEKFLVRPLAPPEPTKTLDEEELEQYRNEVTIYIDDFVARAKSNGVAYATVAFAGNVVHEKIHGLQDPDIPKPIREAQSTYIELEVLKQFGHHNRDKLLAKSAEFFGELVEQFGPDVHRVIFGTAPDEVEKELLPRIKEAFADNMDTIFPNIVWEFSTIE